MRVINRLGPARMTLADVSSETGVAPATLVQRFGSKRGLLLAVARHGAETVDRQFADIRRDHDSAIAALSAVASTMTHMVETPEALANSLAFLQMDLADPQFHKFALQHAHAMRSEIRRPARSGHRGGGARPVRHPAARARHPRDAERIAADLGGRPRGRRREARARGPRDVDPAPPPGAPADAPQVPPLTFGGQVWPFAFVSRQPECALPDLTPRAKLMSR